jgi:hypothetical protein
VCAVARDCEQRRTPKLREKAAAERARRRCPASRLRGNELHQQRLDRTRPGAIKTARVGLPLCMERGSPVDWGEAQTQIPDGTEGVGVRVFTREDNP